MRARRKDTYWLDTINGVYYVHWHDDAAGRVSRKSLHTKDQQEANIGLARFIIGGTAGPVAREHAGVTVAQVLDWYVAQHVRHAVADPDRQENAITHLKAYFGAKRMQDVTIAETRGYAKARELGATGRKGTLSTVRRELNVLVAAANHAIRWEQLPATEAPRVELPAEERETDVPWLSKELLRKVFEAADAQAARLVDTPKRDEKGRYLPQREAAEMLAAFVRVAYYTAARRESIEKLTKQQVDLKNGRINLDTPGRRRTKKRRPIVPLYKEIRPIIEACMAASQTEFVFGKPLDMYRPFVDLLADLGIKAHPHMLRHSRATHMLMDGEDPYKVAKLLGDTLATVEKVYGHHSVDYLATTSNVEDVA